ncbi:hypothetical protein B0T20DRAFT_235697 [Sordaria brevicollis]|uniref:Autophagy protein n=1 Tax=Sordaria brevicollis TaxID=83679 RepID=A0AAE0PDD4_SORBR|nr:hypothetical protein B0T20DRAFT_235697 [Sordaria brevicollis]
MGWLGGWFGGSSSSDESDPLGKLDPKLREFLARESPVKYTTQQEQEQRQRHSQGPTTPVQKAPVQATATTTTKEVQLATEQAQQQEQQQTEKPGVPQASLYKDGRYAHLWKTYRPQYEIENETKTDHEKLMDVLEGFKQRKEMIGKAALENCAEEQYDWNNCMKNGSWTERATMCRDTVRKFERCYNMQSRLLKALGYLQTYNRSPEVDEDIQMHADALYHRMLEQEAEIEKAKAEGRPVPAFPSLFETHKHPTKMSAPQATTEAGGKDPYEPSQEIVDSWQDKLSQLPETDRMAEEEALRAEHRAKMMMAKNLQELWNEQSKEREKRRLEGKETIGDKIKRVLGTPDY